jgi:hypothetical protein
MQSCSIRPAGKASARAFLVQYLTLMLIVLSFMVGAFVTKATNQELSKPSVAETKSAQDESSVIDSFTLELFSAGEVLVQEAQAEALKTVFASHDLNAEIEVSSDVEKRGADAISQAMARALTVKRLLEVKEIPEDAIRVFGRASGGGTHAKISIISRAEERR